MKLYELYAAPKPTPLLGRGKSGLTMYKAEDGRRYLFIVTSNSYRDRENEAIATKALESYVQTAWSIEGHFRSQPLLFWHDGDTIGDIVWADTEGPFLYEVARERANRPVELTTKGQRWSTTVKAVWDALEVGKFRWGASHGFHFSDRALKDGVYKQIAKFETSILPFDAAANPYTFAGVINEMDKDKVLDNLLKTPGLAGKFRRGVRAVKQELDKQGLQHKAAKTKGILEDLDAVIAEFAGKISDGADMETLKQELREALVEALTKGPHSEPDEDNAPDETEIGNAYMEADEEPEVAATGETPMPSAKQIKLLDRLIRSQEKMMADSGETRDAMVKVVRVVNPLPEAVKALTERLDAVEQRLGNAPRRASADRATVIDDHVLTQKAKEQAERYEELFPGSGIKIKG